VSEICSAFGCTPSEAERQDGVLVSRILDYRNAKAAIDLLNGGQAGAAELMKHPELADLLLEMHRAQGTEMTREQLLQPEGGEDHR
jgi:hypothetical protein